MTVQRVVCFKFKSAITEQEINQHMQSFANLKNEISCILSYHGGRTLLDKEKEPDFDSMHYITFNNEDDVALYSNHPATLQFIQENKNGWESVFVLNGTVD